MPHTILRSVAVAALSTFALAAAAAPAEGVSRFRIGALEAFTVTDGSITVANDGKTFGVGRPPADVAAKLKANGLPEDKLTLPIQPLLVRAPGRVLLFDTGAGGVSWAQAGKLQGSLAAAGVSPDQVSDIFISHAHGDHVGGLLDAQGALAFPKAAVHLSAPEWAAMKADKAQATLVAAIAPKVATFAPGATILPGLVKAVEVKGHTPGHSAYQITSGDQQLLYIGDSAHHSVISVQQPNWTIAYDGDAPTAQASRGALLYGAAVQNLRIYGVHFPFPGVGRVKAQGDSFVWVPEAP